MLKVSAILVKIYPIKIRPVLQVSTWSLGGQDGSWHTNNECYLVYNCIYSMCRKFHQILTWITLSRHYLSSKCHPGVLEDRMVPDTLTESIIYFRIVFKTYPESFIQFWHEKPCQDSTYPPSLNFGGLDDGVILTPEVASGVSFNKAKMTYRFG